MKKTAITKLIVILLTFHFSLLTSFSQTLNIQVGSITYQFPADQCGEMIYQDGKTLTILNKEFSLNDINASPRIATHVEAFIY